MISGQPTASVSKKKPRSILSRGAEGAGMSRSLSRQHLLDHNFHSQTNLDFDVKSTSSMKSAGVGFASNNLLTIANNTNNHLLIQDNLGSSGNLAGINSLNVNSIMRNSTFRGTLSVGNRGSRRSMSPSTSLTNKI